MCSYICIHAYTWIQMYEHLPYRCVEVQPIPLGVTFSNAVSKLKAQSSNVFFHCNVAKETFELWALSFRKCHPKWDWLYMNMHIHVHIYRIGCTWIWLYMNMLVWSMFMYHICVMKNNHGYKYMSIPHIDTWICFIHRYTIILHDTCVEYNSVM